MRKPRTSIDTRRKVLDSAARLYTRDSIAATSMRQIAKAAGIQAGSVYNYFESKDQITAEIFDLGIARVEEAVKGALEHGGDTADFPELLRAAILAHLRACFEFGNYTATLIRSFKQAPPRIRAKGTKSRDAYEKLWSRLLKQGVSDGFLSPDIDLKLARLLLLGQMNWTLEWFNPKGKYSLEELALHIERLFVDGYGRADKPRRTKA